MFLVEATKTFPPPPLSWILGTLGLLTAPDRRAYYGSIARSQGRKADMTATAFGSAVSIIALGVADLAAARAFYEALGFQPAGGSDGNIVFFQLGNIVLSLYPRHLLAEDACVDDDGHGFDGVTLARNYASEADVDAAMSHALACGGRLTKTPQKVFWGGYSGYFADPDGHLWELAYNPFAKVDERGVLDLG